MCSENGEHAVSWRANNFGSTGAIMSDDPLLGMHFFEDRGETYVFGEVVQSLGDGFYLARLEERPEAHNPRMIVTRAEMVARRWLLFESEEDLRGFLQAGGARPDRRHRG
jgi:hypothetical protein